MRWSLEVRPWFVQTKTGMRRTLIQILAGLDTQIFRSFAIMNKKQLLELPRVTLKWLGITVPALCCHSCRLHEGARIAMLCFI